MAPWYLWSPAIRPRYLKDSPRRLDEARHGFWILSLIEALASAEQQGYIYAVKLVRGHDLLEPRVFRTKRCNK